MIPSTLHSPLRSAWAPDPSSRPSAAEFCVAIEEAIVIEQTLKSHITDMHSHEQEVQISPSRSRHSRKKQHGSTVYHDTGDPLGLLLGDHEYHESTRRGLASELNRTI